MTIYYSPSTSGFYDTTFADYTLPPDAILITSAQRDSLLAGERSGQVITVVSGVPTLTPAPPKIVPLAQQAMELLARLDSNTIPRIYAAIILGKTTANAADVLAFFQTRDIIRSIALGTNTTATALPTVTYPANT